MKTKLVPLFQKKNRWALEEIITLHQSLSRTLQAEIDICNHHLPKIRDDRVGWEFFGESRGLTKAKELVDAKIKHTEMLMEMYGGKQDEKERYKKNNPRNTGRRNRKTI